VVLPEHCSSKSDLDLEREQSLFEAATWNYVIESPAVERTGSEVDILSPQFPFLNKMAAVPSAAWHSSPSSRRRYHPEISMPSWTAAVPRAAHIVALTSIIGGSIDSRSIPTSDRSCHLLMLLLRCSEILRDGFRLRSDTEWQVYRHGRDFVVGCCYG
jgi:hypothetical protein